MEPGQYTINEIFKELLPYIPGELVSPEILERIKIFNNKFPAALSTAGGFECRLGQNEPSADWQLCVTLADHGREVLAGKTDWGKIDNQLFNATEWRHIRKFASHWSDSGSPLYRRTNTVWLEFDLERLKEQAPVPGLFFNMTPETGDSSKEDLYHCLVDGLTYLKGNPLKKDILDNLLLCLRSLPEDARLGYAALMMSRSPEAVRLILSMDKENLVNYLARIHFPDSTQELWELLEELSQYAGSYRYNLDISHEVLPKIGIECFLHSKKEATKPGWEEFLDYLVRHSLCTREKSEALLRWNGYTRTLFPSDFYRSFIVRRISHVKIVWQKDAPLEAKAYISFWRNFETDILTRRQTICG
jgi:hypothetical protein